MRGSDTFTESLFSIKKLEDFVPATHPLRAIRTMVNDALSQLEELFAGMYEDSSKGGRPSIAPQKLLRAMLLQLLYSVRSERLLMEQVQYNLLFRWFIGLSMEDSVWVPTVFSKNRQRLIEHDAVVAFFNAVLAQAEHKNWLSKEHFSVDGTLIQAWASHMSFVPKGDGGNDADADADGDGSDFRGRPRSNDTQESKTDPDSGLYRKGKTASEMRFMGHTLMENRNGLTPNARSKSLSGIFMSRSWIKGLEGAAPESARTPQQWMQKPERRSKSAPTLVRGRCLRRLPERAAVCAMWAVRRPTHRPRRMP